MKFFLPINIRLTSRGLLILTALLFLLPANAQDPWEGAQEGDTIIIQTFSFEKDTDIAKRDGKYLFPPDTFSYSRIILLYARKCYPEDGHPDPYPCGEWDWNSAIRTWDKEGNRLELTRFVTPYGGGLHDPEREINLNFNGPGWTWKYDITEFAPILYDSVRLFNGESGNYSGEISFGLVDMKFMFIVGTPPRDPIRVRNIYGAIWHEYDEGIDTVLPEKNFDIRSDEKMAEVLMMAAGNCCDENSCPEFCPKTHNLVIDQSDSIPHYLWLDEHCGMNPLYPQGGTWVFARASWCPGSMAHKERFEITPYITPGDSIGVKYALEPYNPSSPAHYSIFGQIVTYSEPNFSLDARVDEIIAPSSWEMQGRHNPICNNPKIVIRNTGATELKSLNITYGAEGAHMEEYTWLGSLDFMESEVVALPPMSRSAWAGTTNRFKVTVSNPNLQTDEYSFNNTMYTTYEIPPDYENQLYLHLRTNNTPEETSWTLENEAGDVLYQSSEDLAASTVYRDTFDLEPGCYTFTLDDSECDGLDFWYHSSKGTGFAHLRPVDTTSASLKTFNPDFGCQVKHQFTVDYVLGNENVAQNQFPGRPDFTIYPNPAGNKLHIGFSMPQPTDVSISIVSVMGREVFNRQYDQVTTEDITIDSEYPSGVYFIQLVSKNYSATKKVIINR